MFVTILNALFTSNHAWHAWFAWYPVTIDGRKVWGRWVERRADYYSPWDYLRMPAGNSNGSRVGATAAVLLLALALTAPAIAADDANGSKAPRATVSVSEVINAGAALKQLDKFKFGGETLLKMAEMLDQADKVQKVYTEAFNSLVKRTYGSMEAWSTLQLNMQADAKKVDAGQMAPGDRKLDEKRDAFQAEADKMFAAPASFSAAKLKRSELCLSEAPPSCPQANAIPVDVLRALLPVMERGQ